MFYVLFMFLEVFFTLGSDLFEPRNPEDYYRRRRRAFVHAVIDVQSFRNSRRGNCFVFGYHDFVASPYSREKPFEQYNMFLLSTLSPEWRETRCIVLRNLFTISNANNIVVGKSTSAPSRSG